MPTPTAAASCHRCTAPLPAERPSRRDACARCGADVRVCKNCALFAPGSHHDCREPAADLVADKERANFCEFFTLALAPARGAIAPDARAALEALFRKA